MKNLEFIELYFDFVQPIETVELIENENVSKKPARRS